MNRHDHSIQIRLQHHGTVILLWSRYGRWSEVDQMLGCARELVLKGLAPFVGCLFYDGKCDTCFLYPEADLGGEIDTSVLERVKQVAANHLTQWEVNNWVGHRSESGYTQC